MSRSAFLSVAAGLLLAVFASASAHAQATQTWVSGVGDDVNPCSRTAPCKTFAGAISKTAAGGEINCLDPGGYGGVTITKAITISCEIGTAGVLVSGTNGINVSAGSTDRVYLKGLDIDGVGTGVNGIRFTSGAALIVQDTVIRRFKASSGLAVAFNPSGVATLAMLNTVVIDNGSNSGGGGIQIAPTGSGVARAILDRVNIDRNYVGMAVIGNGPPSSAQLFNSTISGSATTGLIVAGSGAVAEVGSSVIANNIGAATSGNVLSYLNNQINDNNPDTMPASVGGLR